ncbi:MAG: DUF255 domain-containing protein, partial [Myxococcales bacterium]|nr:DUF255 domain-containing protein [Myxococcales bacterium]
MPRPVANPPNPWLSSHVEWLEEPPTAKLEVFEEQARSIVAGNDSPDIPFRWSINPYRGCYHGCIYCYARPGHEHLGFGAGTDFERKIVVKVNAAALLREHFVTIRVDSDARPDVAERYREWGWPATAFLTPDAQPVLALRGFKNPETFGALLRELVADRDAGTLSQRTSPDDEVRPVEGELGPVLAHATAQIDGFYDEALGGWGRRQKYPFPGPLEHALWRVRIHGERQGLQRAALTLENEKKINDPVWGGVFQYSVDGDWDHPHY